MISSMTVFGGGFHRIKLKPEKDLESFPEYLPKQSSQILIQSGGYRLERNADDSSPVALALNK